MSAPPKPEPPVRFRPRALVLLVSGAALAVAAIASHDSIPLLLAVPLLFGPVAAGLGAARGIGGYRSHWSVDGSREAVEITGRLARSPSGRTAGVFSDLLPAANRSSSANRPRWRRLPRVWPSGCTGPRPYPCLISVARPALVWRDPLGLVERDVPVEGEAIRVQRFPPELARAARAPLRRTTPLPGEVRARQLGPSGEFFGIRPYGSGDTVRQVNWTATARAGRMLANDFRVERTGDLLIVVDLRPSSLGPEVDARLASVACAGAYGLAQSFLEQKARVGLAAVFGEYLTAIPLGSGRRQRYRILRALQAATVGEVAGPSERLAVSLRRYFPPGVTTALLSPLADDDSTLVLPHLRRRGFPAFVLSPSPVTLLAPSAAAPSEDDRRALRLLSLVRRRRVADAWSEAPVVDWDDYWSLAALTSFFARPPAGGRAHDPGRRLVAAGVRSAGPSVGPPRAPSWPLCSGSSAGCRSRSRSVSRPGPPSSPSASGAAGRPRPRGTASFRSSWPSVRSPSGPGPRSSRAPSRARPALPSCSGPGRHRASPDRGRPGRRVGPPGVVRRRRAARGVRPPDGPGGHRRGRGRDRCRLRPGRLGAARGASGTERVGPNDMTDGRVTRSAAYAVRAPTKGPS